MYLLLGKKLFGLIVIMFVSLDKCIRVLFAKNKMKQCADISTQMYLPGKSLQFNSHYMCVFERDVCDACSEDEKEIKSGQTVFIKCVCYIMSSKVSFVLGILFWLQQITRTFLNAV
mmetsp:Transcript_2422/g.3805  ORF Transcript_2422/g.3805 Transcript_2422/m.3805 type:complete len:116 (+) Transcript_2422:21-368(+)